MPGMLTYPEDLAAPATGAAEPSDARGATLAGVSFIDAKPHQYRWPLCEADTNPRHVCGERKRPGSSYCREHGRRAFERKAVVRRRL